MKRILSTIIASVLLVTQVFAQVPAANQITIPQVKQNVITVDKVHPTVLEQLYNMGGLTFFADYSDTENGINADYALGNPMGTFTRTGTAYYTDHTGTMRLAAANTPRITYGVYTESGWTLIDANNKFLIGLMIESAMTNRATYCNTPEDAAWTKTNITADNDDPGSTSPDGTATACSLTASDANGTFTQAYTDASAGIYTSSIFIKRKTGTGTINLRANTGDSYTDITANVKNYWTRIPVSSTSLTNPTFDLQIVTSGDAVYIWIPQLEKNPYMTSPIPSLTTAVARGAEVLKYLIAGNRTGLFESIGISFISLGGSFANDGVNRYITDTDTVGRLIRKETTGNVTASWPNGATSSLSATTSPTINKVHNHFAIFSSSGSNNILVYTNGISEGGSDNTDFAAPAWGTYFFIGCSRTSSGLDRQLNGIFKSISIYNRVLSSNIIYNIANIQ